LSLRLLEQRSADALVESSGRHVQVFEAPLDIHLGMKCDET
jgi:hypothetical protein